ncbi:LytR family transcriptional regulator [Secundilactobacillus kimchicus]|uniref:Transcriptional regulator n=1 Tax=Secundilactobacillus kimchicus JCM 15530 TaxID=1302272 RepID=A0A0R1HKA1_9LACO|nr:LCP family protein [Secundilactobacillus kimchicus]KRK47085.1 Transcriptional regulator [Secundilactobacillus kimchicus JCM 15530]MBT9672495.1 LytR family transcriptional regulator [Secundilactobacillus kimchicus]
MKDELPTRTDRHKKPEKHGKRGSRIRLIIMAVIVLILIGGGVFAAQTYGKLKHNFSKSYSGVGSTTQTTVKAGQPISVLLMGTDTGALGRKDKGRTDTMIVVTINPKSNKTTMVSIPRDTMVNLRSGQNSNAGVEKINAAYTVDGAGGAIKTVENLINVPINYYAIMNMGGLEKIVDAIGGIDVTVPFSWSDSHTHMSFTKGKAHLNGKRALGFARMRYEDPQGDYGRQKRQQQVITAIAKKVLASKSPSEYEKLMSLVADNLRTNLTFDDLVGLAAHDNEAIQNLKKSSLQGTGAYIGDEAFQVTSTKELNRVSALLRGQLGLKKVTLNNFNTRQNKQNVAAGFDFSDGYNPTYNLYGGASVGASGQSKTAQ